MQYMHDMREYPSIPIMNKLQILVQKVYYNDNWIPVIPKTREHKNWLGKKYRLEKRNFD